MVKAKKVIMGDHEFDEQSFIECFLDGYGQDDDIAEIDDMYCVLDNEIYDDEKRERLQRAGYFDMSINQLKKELHELEGFTLARAFRDYLHEYYPEIETNFI